jgi:hypothetical protein
MMARLAKLQARRRRGGLEHAERKAAGRSLVSEFFMVSVFLLFDFGLVSVAGDAAFSLNGMTFGPLPAHCKSFPVTGLLQLRVTKSPVKTGA